MPRKTTYSTVSVDNISASDFLQRLVDGCVLALDVAKTKMVCALASVSGEVLKIFRWEHPTDSLRFLELASALQAGLTRADPGASPPSSTPAQAQAALPPVRVVVEPTGTYGDSLRHQLELRGVPVHAISPKVVHDSRELFDGVPSLHDGKSAVLLAKLAALGRDKPWTPRSPQRRQLRALVDLRALHFSAAEPNLGKLEAMLARHWPEFGQWLDVSQQSSALELLAKFSGPEAVTEAPLQAAELLRQGSRKRLSEELIEGVVTQAAQTLGVPMMAEERALMRAAAEKALDERRRMKSVEKEIRRVASREPGFKNLVAVLGPVTAATLIAYANPLEHRNAKALEKACGLNLREKSSGEKQGKRGITKRGPSELRKLLYLAALRKVYREPVVRAWYENRSCYPKGDTSSRGAIVAVMRKLVRVSWHVARGASWDAEKFCDTRKLTVNERPKPETNFEPRKAPRTTTTRRDRQEKRGAAQATR